MSPEEFQMWAQFDHEHGLLDVRSEILHGFSLMNLMNIQMKEGARKPLDFWMPLLPKETPKEQPVDRMEFFKNA